MTGNSLSIARRLRTYRRRLGGTAAGSAGGALALAAGLVLTGCAVTAGQPAPEATAAELVASATTDSQTCASIGDVFTITFNADTAVREGRMGSQEQQGWYRLAARALHQAPTSGEGAVSESVADLQAAVPAIARGAMGSTEIGSEEWRAAYMAVTESCAKAGFEVAIEGFTGG